VSELGLKFNFIKKLKSAGLSKIFAKILFFEMILLSGKKMLVNLLIDCVNLSFCKDWSRFFKTNFSTSLRPVNSKKFHLVKLNFQRGWVFLCDPTT
jgi:hypothetical protein